MRYLKREKVMIHSTTSYTLIKGEENITFNSEKDACKFLGVAKSTVSSCYGKKSKCKGYSIIKNGITTHHATKTRLYKIWDGMRERCTRAKHPYYHSYGGRGISVCDEWQSFYNFKNWAENNGYSDTLTLDRIDVNGNYFPDNCRWVTMKTQANNKSTNHYITINNETMTLSECSERFGIPKSTIRWREMNNRDIISGARMDGESE